MCIEDRNGQMKETMSGTVQRKKERARGRETETARKRERIRERGLAIEKLLPRLQECVD